MVFLRELGSRNRAKQVHLEFEVLKRQQPWRVVIKSAKEHFGTRSVAKKIDAIELG